MVCKIFCPHHESKQAVLDGCILTPLEVIATLHICCSSVSLTPAVHDQDDAKRLVQELVVWPMLNPALCQVRIPQSRKLGFATILRPSSSCVVVAGGNGMVQLHKTDILVMS